MFEHVRTAWGKSSLCGPREGAYYGVALQRATRHRPCDRFSDASRGAPMLQEGLRAFSPHVWQQQIRSRLQSMGLLSVPKLRIWILTGISAMLFFFVLFWLLPSAQIRVWPREDTVSQTANVWLVQSGSTVEVPTRVRKMELLPIRVEVTRSFTFDQVSKDFVGENSHGDIAVVNKADELYSLRKGTRIANNAGMIFLLLDPVNVEPGEGSSHVWRRPMSISIMRSSASAATSRPDSNGNFWDSHPTSAQRFTRKTERRSSAERPLSARCSTRRILIPPEGSWSRSFSRPPSSSWTRRRRSTTRRRRIRSSKSCTTTSSRAEFHDFDLPPGSSSGKP